MRYIDSRQLTLLPEPPLVPTYPNPFTIEGRLLRRLLAGERISQLAFIDESWRLAAYVDMLQQRGWPVLSRDIRPIGYANRPIAEYWLMPETIAAANAATKAVTRANRA